MTNIAKVFTFAFLSLSSGLVSAADISTYSFSGCAFPDTNKSTSYTATLGEDHDYASSVSTMSFTIYNGVDWGGTATSSVTVDNRTGLMWMTNPNDAGRGGLYTWEGALTACEGLTYAGFSDWRLPNVRELLSILDYGQTSGVFINTKYLFNPQACWSSTTPAPANTSALIVSPYGQAVSNLKTNTYYVRCVRGGPP